MAIRKLFLLFFITALFIPQLLFAQEYHDIESNNIRVDPAWIKLMETGGFSWAQDIKTDKTGNIYTAGYFSRYLETGGKTVSPNCREGDCSNLSFITKHDSKGNLKWIRYAKGNSRPCRLALDSRGFIYMAGNVWSKSLRFSSVDTSTVKLDKPADFNTGIYLCQYNPDGQVIQTNFLKASQQQQANDIFLDSKNNLYIAGNYNYQSYKRRGEINRSLLLLKLNKKGKLLWQIQGDTLGTSQLNSVYVHESGTVYVTGNFSKEARLGKKIFRQKYSNGKLLLAGFSANGKLKWATDSIGNVAAGSGQTIACDVKGNLYLYGSLVNNNVFLARLHKDGSLMWAQSSNGKSQYPERMVLDEANNIYLCGYGYGAVFGSAGPNVISYKPKGGTDFFLAKYSDQGELKWLKAGGGEGTDYARAIALLDNDLLVLGSHNAVLQFRDSTLTAKGGYPIWLARFSRKKLEKIDNTPQEKYVPLAERKPELNLNSNSCTCDQPDNQKAIYPSLLKNLVTYPDFTSSTKWKDAGPDNFFDHLFFYKFQNSVGRAEVFNALTLVSFRPIRLMHPNNTFALNLTPCSGEKKMAEIPVTMNYSHQIRRYDAAFDYENFNHTAKEYFRVLRLITGRTDNAMLHQVLLDYTVTDLQKFITGINKKYKTAIKIVPDNTEATIRNISEELSKNKITVHDFILQEFVLSAPGKTHKVTAIEEERLQAIFNRWLGYFSLSDIDKKVIYPDIEAEIGINQLQVEISEKIVRQWDVLKNQAAKNDQGNYVPANILLEVPFLKYSSINGIDSPEKSTCFTRSEIAGTNILLSFNKSVLIGAEEKTYSLIDSRNYPLFITDSVLVGGHDFPKHFSYKYDSLLTRFTGLYVPEAQLNIPLKGQVFTANGRNIILNNYLISGVIELPLLPETANVKGPLKIKTGETETSVTLKELQENFVRLGLKKVKLVKETNVVKVYFRKGIQ